MKKPRTPIRIRDSLNNPRFKELWLHHIWAKKALVDQEYRTLQGERVEILFTGWYNRDWGPDFKEARLNLGNRQMFGDVEIHIREKDWYRHNHHRDANYNKVILHIFLQQDIERAKNQLGQECNALFLDETSFSNDWNLNANINGVSIKNIPGACGLILTEKQYPRLKRIIFQASEQRLQDKAHKIQSEIQNFSYQEQEDYLFRLIGKATGYSAYAESFDNLLRHFPASTLMPLFRHSLRQAKTEVLSRWFGYLGLLSKTPSDKIHDELRREWTAMQIIWERISQDTKLLPNLPKKGRPQNSPLRRLTGLFYHLEQVHFQGLTKSWMAFINLWDNDAAHQKTFPATLNKELEKMFPQTQGDPLAPMLSPVKAVKENSAIRFIGKERQRIILINAIIPFFIAWSQLYKNTELEKKLFAIFLGLPGEGANQKTRFFETRLLQQHSQLTLKKNLSYYQGLIQLHDECCHSFYEGCQNCTLLQLLHKTSD